MERLNDVFVVVIVTVVEVVMTGGVIVIVVAAFASRRCSDARTSEGMAADMIGHKWSSPTSAPSH